VRGRKGEISDLYFFRTHAIRGVRSFNSFWLAYASAGVDFRVVRVEEIERKSRREFEESKKSRKKAKAARTPQSLRSSSACPANHSTEEHGRYR